MMKPRSGAYLSPLERTMSAGLWAYGVATLIFLVVPLLVVVPLSFNSGSFLSFPLAGISLRWYEALFASSAWTRALRNSVVIGLVATALATVLGTAAALGLKRLSPGVSRVLSFVVLSPIVVPVVISAVGLYFLYAPFGLVNSTLGLALSHTVLATPFVVITVMASLDGFDMNLQRAAQACGASPFVAFRRVMLPLILPGVVSGAIFAFAVSFDDVVMALFLAGPEQRTLPVQMFNGVREEINPIIAAAATLLILLAVTLLALVEFLRRRSARLAGKPR
jgi:putative spermidine/putrescine transport system permease protein